VTTTSDGFLVDWGDRPNYKPIKGRRGKNIRGGAPKPSTTAKPPRPAGRAAARAMRFDAMLRKAPEAVIKVTGGGTNIEHIKAHMDYISRNGEIEVEAEDRLKYLGTDQVLELRDAWANSGYRIPRTGEERKEAINIVLSMPAGTNREAVTAAVREFAAERFGDHQYIFAQHNDEKHTHVHLTVKKVNMYGTRLNPKKADLMDWREHFVERLWDQGIKANATPRRARGIVYKQEKGVVAQLQKNGKYSTRVAQRQEAVKDAVSRGRAHENPHGEKIAATRQSYLQQYHGIAQRLARSEDPADREKAFKLVEFVKSMPTLRSRHQVIVDDILAQRTAGSARDLSQATNREVGTKNQADQSKDKP